MAKKRIHVHAIKCSPKPNAWQAKPASLHGAGRLFPRTQGMKSTTTAAPPGSKNALSENRPCAAVVSTTYSAVALAWVHGRNKNGPFNKSSVATSSITFCAGAKPFNSSWLTNCAGTL